MNIYIGNSRLNGNDKTDVFSAMEYFDILDYNPLFSDVHCGLSVHLHTNVNKNTTTQDIGEGSNPIQLNGMLPNKASL